MKWQLYDRKVVGVVDKIWKHEKAVGRNGRQIRRQGMKRETRSEDKGKWGTVRMGTNYELSQAMRGYRG